MYAGAEGRRAFQLSLIKAIWFNGLYDAPPEELDDIIPVYANQLYTDLKFKTAQECYQRLP